MKIMTLLLIVCFFILSACCSSAVEKCEKSNVDIRCVITGEGVGIVSVTQRSNTGGMELGDLAVPYRRIMSGLDEGGPLYISAQINGDLGS